MKHWKNWKRTGDPVPNLIYGNDDARFERWTRKEGECLIWKGTVSRDGYARWKVGGRKGRNVQVHRWVYERTHGPIPDGLLVCHTCDTRACVEIEHLFLGTNADNTSDMIQKGRAAWQVT